jgi:hypothetical protein
MSFLNSSALARPAFLQAGDPRPLFAAGIMPDNGHGTLAEIVPDLAPPLRPKPEKGSREALLHHKLCCAFKDTHDRMLIPRGDGAMAAAKQLAIELTIGRLRTKISCEPRHAVDPGTLLMIAIDQFAGAVNGVDLPNGALDMASLRYLLAWLEGYRMLHPLNDDIRRHSLHGLCTLVAKLIEYCG